MAAGFEKLMIQVLDKDDYAVPGQLFEFNAVEGGAIDAKVSGLGSTSNTTYASNVPFHVSAVGVSAPKLEIGVVDLDDVEGAFEAITGAEKDAEGTLSWSSKTRPPYVAVILKSSDKDGNALYMAMLKGKLTYDGTEFKTMEDKGEELGTDSVSGDFIARKSDEKVTMKDSEKNPTFELDAFKAKVFQVKPAG